MAANWCWDSEHSQTAFFATNTIVTNTSFYHSFSDKEEKQVPTSIYRALAKTVRTSETLTALCLVNSHWHFRHPPRKENSKNPHCSKLILFAITGDKDQCQMKNMTLPKTTVPKLTPDSTEENRVALGFRFPALHYFQGQVTCTTIDAKHQI